MRVEALLVLPIVELNEIAGVGEFFDPWSLFPGVYGIYCEDFDQCAIEILNDLTNQRFERQDLGARMFREMLCTASLCMYGTSPRTCFPTPDFLPLVSRFMGKWKDYAFAQWGDDMFRRV